MEECFSFFVVAAFGTVLFVVCAAALWLTDPRRRPKRRSSPSAK